MPASWATAPKDWATNDPLDETTFDTEFRDRFLFIIENMIPTGVVQAYVGTTPPTGWLLCNGAEISRTTYADLYTIIGDAFGNGDGSTTFELPDLRGRVVIGVGTGSGLTARAMADEVGAETHQLTESELASHSHSIPAGASGSTHTQKAGDAGDSVSTDAAGSDTAHANVQPSLAMNYIIKTGVYV